MNLKSWAIGRSAAGKVAAVLVAGALIAGCSGSSGGGFTKNYQKGYMLPEGALEQIQIGASQEQVLVILGTPSTVATVSGEVFYYVSRKTSQTSFLPETVRDQRVVAVYFDKSRRVNRVANFGLQDGKVFDFVSRTTPSGGQELSYLTYIFKIIGTQ